MRYNCINNVNKLPNICETIEAIVLLHVSTITFKIAHYNLNTAFDKQKNVEEDYVMAYSHYMKNRTATSLSMTNWWLPSDCVEFFPIW